MPPSEQSQIPRSEQAHSFITGLAAKAQLDKSGTDSLRSALDATWKNLTTNARKAGKIPISSINLPPQVNNEKGKVDLLTKWGIIPDGSTFENVVAEMQKNVKKTPNSEQALAEIFKPESPKNQAFVDPSGTHALLAFTLDSDVRLILADGNLHLAVNPEVFKKAEKTQAVRPDTGKEVTRVKRMGMKEFFSKLLGLDRLRIFFQFLNRKRQPIPKASGTSSHSPTLSPQPSA
jgi:hypothetical protein